MHCINANNNKDNNNNSKSNQEGKGDHWGIESHDWERYNYLEPEKCKGAVVGQAEVQKIKVGKMWRKTEKEARQYHVPARPKRTLQNAERRGGTWKRDSRNGKVCRVLGRYLEREERTPNMPWMEEIRRQLNEKVNQVNEFNIIFEKGSGKEKRMDSIWNRWKVMESPGKNGSTIKFIMTGCWECTDG